MQLVQRGQSSVREKERTSSLQVILERQIPLMTLKNLTLLFVHYGLHSQYQQRLVISKIPCIIVLIKMA